MEYKEFILSKTHSSIDHGIEPTFIPDMAFDHQKYIIGKSVRKGRFGNFLDTGTGKTLISLSVAHNYVQNTNKPVLIITPLAVAFQFIDEAEKFGIPDVEQTKDGKYSKDIILCNYERLHYIDPNDFDCVILDESSILKNFDGKTKLKITSFLKKVKYRYLLTATPSPNDYIELGTSSEALGYMGYTDMLTKFFRNNNNSIDARHSGDKWYLKPHAERNFWRWVCSWSIAMRKPSDLGFSDEGYDLPPLIENDVIIQNKTPLAVGNQTSLFALPAKNFFEVKAEVRATVTQRCEKAVEVSSGYDSSVYWVNLNDEADLIERLDPDAVQIKGTYNLDKKEEILIAFSRGEIKKLVTKARITSFGLNWQHCNHTVFFPTYSYEQYYQAIRRQYRFGQKNAVTVDRIYSDGQIKVMEALGAKKLQAIEMFANLVKEMNSEYKLDLKKFDKEIINPNF